MIWTAGRRKWAKLRGRFAAMRHVMSSTPGLIGSDYATREQAWEMLEGLFSPFAHGLTAAAIAIIAWYNWYADGSLASMAAVAIASATFSLRFIFNRRILRRGPDALVSHWVRLFVASSFIAAVGWGSSLSILIFTTGHPAVFAVFALISAPVQGASARAYAMPGTVIVHISIVLGMVGVAATVFGIAVAIPLVLLYLWYQIGFIFELVALRTKMLKADHDRRALLSEVTRYNADLAVVNARLQTFALTDGLTGVGNRRDFDEKLGLCVRDQPACAAPLALLLIDVDHFKRFNDTYGHLAGDECLKQVAATIRRVGRPDDFTARYGGEEFALILPETTREDALLLAEQVRQAVDSIDFRPLPDIGAPLTVSIGVGVAAAGATIQPQDLVEAADSALYLAKQRGRNCVMDGAVERQSIRLPA
ncbi:GGDEF domain-containing protein [Rhodopseudomonas sp. RCAM05734]|uniref:GGDEF domain-containing protein n=1 Tax=Rhodopseudomonas sp. RCAM05734 TaxID=3457549 RepID=UPI00404496FF